MWVITIIFKDQAKWDAPALKLLKLGSVKKFFPSSNSWVFFPGNIIDQCPGLPSKKASKAPFAAVLYEVQGNTYYAVMISREVQGVLQGFFSKW